MKQSLLLILQVLPVTFPHSGHAQSVLLQDSSPGHVKQRRICHYHYNQWVYAASTFLHKLLETPLHKLVQMHKTPKEGTLALNKHDLSITPCTSTFPSGCFRIHHDPGMFFNVFGTESWSLQWLSVKSRCTCPACHSSALEISRNSPRLVTGTSFHWLLEILSCF